MMRYRKTTFWYLVLACCWGRSTSIPQQVIEDVKSALLPLFGFKDRPPKIAGKADVPEALKKLYQRQNDFYWDTASFPLPGLRTESANTVRSFTHVESPIDANFKEHHHRFRLKFNLNSIPKEERLKAAELQITRDLLDIKDDFKVRVLLHDITHRGKKGIHGPITRVIDSKMIDLRKNTTLSFDIEPAVVRWLDNPSQNYGVLVQVVDGKSKPKHLRLKRESEGDESWPAKQPVLLAYTDDGRNKQDLSKMRSRRAPKKPRKSDHCRRKPMYVNFSQVGWSDWIVAPLGYDAFHCTGVCEYPMAEHMNTTNHAIVQSLMNSARPGEVPKPCCVPTQLTSMSMLYLDGDRKVILKNYKEMVVIGCGCR